MKTYAKKNQNGRSMIEMLGVLAIVGVLSAGGIAGYSMAMQSYKTNQLIDKIQLIAARTRQVYKGNYVSGVSKANMISSGKLSENDFVNPFGGTLVLARSGWDSTGTIFHIELGDLPAETCTDILTNDWGGSGVFDGVVFDHTEQRYRLRYVTNNWPIEKTEAITLCSGGVTNFTIVLK